MYSSRDLILSTRLIYKEMDAAVESSIKTLKGCFVLFSCGLMSKQKSGAPKTDCDCFLWICLILGHSLSCEVSSCWVITPGSWLSVPQEAAGPLCSLTKAFYSSCCCLTAAYDDVEQDQLFTKPPKPPSGGERFFVMRCGCKKVHLKSFWEILLKHKVEEIATGFTFVFLSHSNCPRDLVCGLAHNELKQPSEAANHLVRRWKCFQPPLTVREHEEALLLQAVPHRAVIFAQMQLRHGYHF